LTNHRLIPKLLALSSASCCPDAGRTSSRRIGRGSHTLQHTQLKPAHSDFRPPLPRTSRNLVTRSNRPCPTTGSGKHLCGAEPESGATNLGWRGLAYQPDPGLWDLPELAIEHQPAFYPTQSWPSGWTD